MSNLPVTRPSVTAVVPVFNGEKSLEELVRRLDATLSSAADRFEIILVNDASRDGSWAICARLAGRDPRIRAFDLTRNYGQHNALLCGIRAASHEVIVTLDDDLQHPPEEIPKLLAALTEGADVVYGAPVTEQHGLWRDLASVITKRVMQSTIGVTPAQHVGGFRAFRTAMRDGFSGYQGWWVNIDVLLTWATTRFAAILVEQRPRAYGASNYTFRALTRHGLNLLTGFSTLPLQFASILGFSLTSFGAVLLCYVWGRYFLRGVSVPGFTFLASVIVLFTGAQLFTLGIIGEYLGRIHFRTMERPCYTVRQVAGAPAREHD